MSDSYVPHYTDGGDFIDKWQPNITNTVDSSENLDSEGRSFPTSFSELVFSEAEFEINPATLDFLNAPDLLNLDAAIPQGQDLNTTDLSLDWTVPFSSSKQFSNARILDNTVLPLKNANQPFIPFSQQFPANNFPISYFDQNLGQDTQDCPLSVYPPLDFDNATNSLPYGRQVLQQFGQPSNSNDDLGFNPNAQPASNNTIQEDTISSNAKIDSSLGNSKVSLSRAAKQRGDPSCDPSLCYASDPSKITPWGSLTWNGQHLFSYTPKGQWLHDRCFTKEQFREYADNCGKDTVFWVQQAPTQCNHRLEPEDRVCRWANCPVSNRTITAGWLRVAFDEFPHLTSSGARDPLKCAGSVHLWCFEQIFDPAEFHLSGRLRPEDRQFPFEDKSVVTLEKLTDAGIVREAYRPWFEQRTFSLSQQPREYRDSLSYRLTKYHIEHQTAARQKARSKRNDAKSVSERRTIDVHLGNLEMFVAITNRVRKSKKIRRLRRVEDEDADVLSDSSQSLSLTGTRATENRRQMAMKNWRPETTRGNTLSRTQSSTQSTIQPFATTTSAFPNYLQNSYSDISSQSYSQNVMGARCNRATQTTSRPVKPILTQPLQQYSRRDAFTQTTGETLQLPVGSSNGGFFDSRQWSSRAQALEGLDFSLLIDPMICEVDQHQQEDVSEANDDAFTAHTQMFPAASQPLGIMDCAVSPQATVLSPYWNSLMDFGGFGGAGCSFPSPQPQDFTVTNGYDGERVGALTGVSVQHVSPEVTRKKRESLNPIEATQNGQDSKKRRTRASQL